MTEVSFVGLQPSDAIRDHAARRVATLAHDPAMRSCRVVLEASHHSRFGNRFRAKYELAVRDGERLIVGARGHGFDDVYAAIDAGYDGAKRLLHEHVSRRRDERRRS
jgi:ribosome-associated translation inhibitor RaiA